MPRFALAAAAVAATAVTNVMPAEVLAGGPPTCFGRPATIVGPNTDDGAIDGTRRDDVIVGTPQRDSIWGGPGDDLICALGGDDTVGGEGGSNLIDGGEGIDTIHAGADSYFGGDEDWEGADEPEPALAGDRNSVWGGPGKDFINGSDGVDFLSGGGGDDIIDGWKGVRDTCAGGPGDDRLSHCERELQAAD